ncbi:MAG: hypothetical protein V3575_03855 [Candidatus Absconditabacteria bacterium]
MVKKLLNGMVFGTGAFIVLGLFMLGVWFVNGSDSLTATNGETLTAEKWNALVDKVNTNISSSSSVNIKQVELSSPTDISISISSGRTSLSGMNISNFEVGNSGEVLVTFSCSNKYGLPSYRVSINGGASYKNLGGTNTHTAIYGNVSGQVLLENLSQGSLQSYTLQVSNGTSGSSIVFPIVTEPHYGPCRMIATSY